MPLKSADPAVTEKKIRQFFEAYEGRINRALGERPEIDIEAEARVFTESFIEAHPGGVIAFDNDDEFRAAIPQNYAFQRSVGTQSMQIATLEITHLDEYHAMAKVHWNAQYRRKDNSEIVIDFDEVYLMQTIDDTPKIFAYIAGDQEKLLKDHGIVAK